MALGALVIRQGLRVVTTSRAAHLPLHPRRHVQRAGRTDAIANAYTRELRLREGRIAIARKGDQRFVVAIYDHAPTISGCCYTGWFATLL